MAETKEKKGFNAALYAVIAGIVVAVLLALITIFAFTTRYTGFSAEKVAQAYVDTIVQTGDGYNAYKNTLVSINQKFGMKPYINEDAEKASFVGTGSDEEITKTDEVYDTMYEYYVGLVAKYGLDDIDAIFNDYFAKLTEVRKEIFGDEYMDTDFMFSVFESNVTKYGKSLTGTEEEYGADGKTVIQEASTGKYQEIYGNDYKERITPVASSGEAKADKFGLKDTDKKNTPKSDMIGAFEKLDNSNDISAVAKCTVDVTLEDGKSVASQQVYVVKIGNTWYVDNTNVDTSALYLAK